MICKRLPCQTGGGIRSIARAHELLALGARRVIFGSSLLKDGAINTALARKCAKLWELNSSRSRSTRAAAKLPSRAGRKGPAVHPADMIRALDPYCSAFLYTHIDTEGTMTGFPINVARELSALTQKRLIVAGGIKSRAEVDELDSMGVDAVVGMAIYTGAME